MFNVQSQTNTSKYQQIKKYFLTAMIILISISAILGISFVLFGASLRQFQVIGTTVTLGVAALLMAGNVSRLDARPTIRVLAIISLIANLIAMTIIILSIWGIINIDCDRGANYDSCYHTWLTVIQVISQTFSICLNVSLTLSIIGRFLTYTPKRQLTSIVCRTTIVCAAIVGIIFACWTLAVFWVDEVSLKLIIVLCIVLVFGLIATPILIKIEQNHEKQIANNTRSAVDEQALRAQIEQEVRAKIATEQSQTDHKEEWYN